MKAIAYEGAGFIYITPKKTVLMLQKPNKKWTFPGGHSEFLEEPLETAMRESIEELGIAPEGDILTYFGYIKPDTKGQCYSFLKEIEKEFKPKLSSEHRDYKWVKIKDITKLTISKSVEQVIKYLNRYAI